MPCPFWFCIRPYPALPYTGLWTPGGPSEFLRSLYLIRSGQIYRAESLPFNLPIHCEGENFNTDWGVPAVYRQVSETWWVGLTRGCVDGKGKVGPIYPNRENFCFTYPAGSNRLHIYADGGVSHPLKWRRTSRTELELELTWGR